MDVRDKRIVLGVSGGIAAYKAVEVCRRLVDAGAFVSPVLTRNARRFVGTTTFSAVASEPVRTALWGGAEPSPHTVLGQGADLVLVVPATAHFLSAYAAGASSDLLTATLLATVAPVVVCPAMHAEMWMHPAVRENVETLSRRGVTIVAPEEGHLAGGDVGVGRLASPDVILAAVVNALGPDDLSGLRVLVTAGGTREPIDPVRFLGNRSTGKQGHALAAEAVARGASVVLITTSDLATPAGVEVIRVDTAEQMHRAVTEHEAVCDVVVMAAAVADFRPVSMSATKIKKADGVPNLVLEPTVDIVAELGATRTADQTLVGFAAETHRVEDFAVEKIQRKGLDLVVANDVTAPGAGFSHETNAVEILTAAGGHTRVPLVTKREVAAAVFDAVIAVRLDVPSRSTSSE